MKKRSIIAACSFVCAIVCLLVFAVVIDYNKGVGISNTATVKKETEYAYVIRYSEDAVKVYDNKTDEYLYALDVDVNILPEADRESLEKGMYIEDKKRLNKVVEDLTG